MRGQYSFFPYAYVLSRLGWSCLLLFFSACQDPVQSATAPARSSTCEVAVTFRGEQPVAGRKGAMVLLPYGCRNMWNPGQPKAPKDSFFCVGPYWMDSVELSIARYESVMGRNTSFLHNGMFPQALPICPTCPIENLSYFDAILVANALTKREISPVDTVYSYDAVQVYVKQDTASLTGAAWAYAMIEPSYTTGLVNLRVDTTKNGYRLPTDQEWAWAAMGDFNPFTLSEEYPDSVFQWTSSLASETTHPVGSKPWTLWGLHDMKGNAWEWIGSNRALGGGWRGPSSFDSDLRNDAVFGDEAAGVRFVRRVQASEQTTSVRRRSCQ